MDILIIGNGFDLAHGLETSYCDFLNFYQNPEFKEYAEKLPIYNKCLQTNLWMKHFINTQANIKGKNWIDLEQEIFDVIKILNDLSLNISLSDTFGYFIYSVELNGKNFQFNNIKTLIKKRNTEHYELFQEIDPAIVKEKGYSVILKEPYDDVFCVYVQNFEAFVNFLYDQLREFTEAFQEYIKIYALIQLPISPYKLILKNYDEKRDTGSLFVLNFNYTNICEKLYKGNSYCRGFEIKTIHLHGNIDNPETCNLVLGSKTFKDFQTNIHPAYNVFQKHNQRHKYATIENFQDFYLKILSKTSANVYFHVIGHSLDESDLRILKLIFNAKQDSIIYIYYHDEEVHQKLINNITQIITEDEVTARVRFIKQHDQERGILDKINGPISVSRSLC